MTGIQTTPYSKVELDIYDTKIEMTTDNKGYLHFDDPLFVSTLRSNSDSNGKPHIIIDVYDLLGKKRPIQDIKIFAIMLPNDLSKLSSHLDNTFIWSLHPSVKNKIYYNKGKIFKLSWLKRYIPSLFKNQV